jgi:hypothetical protein
LINSTRAFCVLLKVEDPYVLCQIAAGDLELKSSGFSQGKQHCETKMRLVDAERRKAEIEVALAGGTWRDPRRGDVRLVRMG